MKVTYNWLKQFVDFDIAPQELAKKLTSCGMEVEEMAMQNEHLHNVVVGKILKIERHPQADKLVVCQVDIGSEVTQIITAATNVFEGAIVPVSLPGADLCNGIKIEKSKLRGVDSCGMFCSGQELGIDENYFENAGIDGILILPIDFKIGMPIDEALMLNDVVFDVNVTPNRADCMSVIGLAREVSAVLRKPFKEPDLSFEVEKNDSVLNYVNVEVKTENCPRYLACAIKNIEVRRSPLWLRSRLNAVGIKPINTIVDITNYVLMEMGQPLHAFDAAYIGGKEIIVRQAKSGEKIDALNHNSYTLDESVMVIADKNKPMVIAGIIGGTNSCINEQTKICVLESACFDLKNIRLTSKKIGVRTDSCARYCKGVNVASPEVGMKRALNLISTLGCGTIVDGSIDKAFKSLKERKIEGSVNEINKILGIEISSQNMKEILDCLGIKTNVDGDKLSCVVPAYREDIENDYDLAEEIIRMYGYDVYDALDKRLFDGCAVTEGKYLASTKLVNKLKRVLTDSGFYEALNYSLCPGNLAEKLLISDDRKNLIPIANPIAEDISHMRTSLAHSLLSDVAYNIRLGNKELKFFEYGRTYLPKSLPLCELANEKNILAFAVSDSGYDFFNLKSVIENLLNEVGIDASLVPSIEPYLHQGISGDLMLGEDKIGHFGQVHPSVAINYEVPNFTLYGELDIDLLSNLPEKRIVVKAVPKFPVVERDLAVVVDESVKNSDLLSAIKSSCGKLFYEVNLFDIYRSESLGKDKKSMAYNIKLSDENKTLTEEEVIQTINKILKALSFRYGAKLR